MTRRKPRPLCAMPGCRSEVAYRVRASWLPRPIDWCEGCTWGIARWVVAHWPAARMDAVPL